ncbi:hypothetical protein K466DRAFT_602495 [Polyporus arcularius HHB13444]|uniref:DUF6533 domain-containing protein n=1 Tax=Polyporus arcularius HHB13444 TaxID=1314778 RepID=A0A5C3P338_9APHY|nr:hypothetical protein K466DRAFT_602495 [Polyporus arcularius HHB13444]
MSSDADDAAATVALFDSFYTIDYCAVASSVIFIYDALITLDREVAYLWTAKRVGGASLLFLANKWISMAVYVMVLVGFTSFPSDKVSYGYQVSGVNSPPLGCVYEDNTTVALDLKFVSFNLIKCIGSDSVQGDRTVVIIARVPLIAADILLIYITWTMLKGRAALTHFQQSKRLTLSDVLFRGGVIYFVILFILNVLHLVLTAAPVAIDNGYGSFVTAFTAPYVSHFNGNIITAILTSRFLLALQEANQTVVRLDPDDPLHSSRNPWDSGTPSFISSLGGFVNPARLARSDDDDGFVELTMYYGH